MLVDVLPAANFLMLETAPQKREPLEFPGSQQLVLWLPEFPTTPQAEVAEARCRAGLHNLRAPRYTIRLLNPPKMDPDLQQQPREPGSQ